METETLFTQQNLNKIQTKSSCFIFISSFVNDDLNLPNENYEIVLNAVWIV